MNQQIDNALGGYEEPTKPAPDTLLEQIKELWPRNGALLIHANYRPPFIEQMADHIIADAEEMENLKYDIEGYIRISSTQAEEIERLREALEKASKAIDYMLEDMKERMDNDKHNDDVSKKYGGYKSCSGEKSDDGFYTFPMGQSALIGVEAASAAAKQTLKESEES